MALQKRRHSTTRGRKRRTHWKIKIASLTLCPQCKTPKPTHTVCPVCGTYKGRQAIEVREKKEKKRRSG